MAAFFSIVSLRGGFVRFECADKDEGAVSAIAVNGESARRDEKRSTKQLGTRWMLKVGKRDH
ncbi:hypothetical protein HPB52_015069 [Rhipicephalus sanguineus]|uniref:Uncharacterized protein n=1 Tax=Rhipicephalus sanguineus TaxID=34632 RepID=A0A9D4Q0K1_RHISA|nr:hypothetical protein HPB52_015069 [Rhipicephalus sanguineus]